MGRPSNLADTVSLSQHSSVSWILTIVVRVYWLRKDTLGELRRVLEPFVIRLLELEYLLVDGWPRRAKLEPAEAEGKWWSAWGHYD